MRDLRITNIDSSIYFNCHHRNIKWKKNSFQRNMINVVVEILVETMCVEIVTRCSGKRVVSYLIYVKYYGEKNSFFQICVPNDITNYLKKRTEICKIVSVTSITRLSLSMTKVNKVLTIKTYTHIYARVTCVFSVVLFFDVTQSHSLDIAKSGSNMDLLQYFEETYSSFPKFH